MNTKHAMFCLRLLLLPAFLGETTTVHGQGIIDFDARNNWVGTHYVESGMAFQVVMPQGENYDYMGIGYGAGNTPYNGTPWMGWIRQNNPYDYVSLSLTNGDPFGLISVKLADPIYPSVSPIPISFIGLLADGTTVTNTFVTPDNGTRAFGTYAFNPSFSSGLTRVDILAPRWAMDNLVFVPEPGTVSLSLLGLAALTWRLRGRKTAP